jgi:hypothetical protein
MMIPNMYRVKNSFYRLLETPVCTQIIIIAYVHHPALHNNIYDIMFYVFFYFFAKTTRFIIISLRRLLQNNRVPRVRVCSYRIYTCILVWCSVATCNIITYTHCAPQIHTYYARIYAGAYVFSARVKPRGKPLPAHSEVALGLGFKQRHSPQLYFVCIMHIYIYLSVPVAVDWFCSFCFIFSVH